MAKITKKFSYIPNDIDLVLKSWSITNEGDRASLLFFFQKDGKTYLMSLQFKSVNNTSPKGYDYSKFKFLPGAVLSKIDFSILGQYELSSTEITIALNVIVPETKTEEKIVFITDIPHNTGETDLDVKIDVHLSELKGRMKWHFSSAQLSFS